jgi:uncharacterized protein YndB with AHSA1/START domain
MASIKHLFHIAAPQQQVFEAISTIEGLQNWWTTVVTGSSEPGGVLAFRFNGMGPDFKVTGISAGLSLSWECVAGFDDWIGTVITFHLDRNEGKTRVRFEHANWAETGDHYAACSFSWGRYLESLRQYCEAGTGTPFNG